MGFGANAIAIVTGGLRFSTGTFPERLVSWGYASDIGDNNPGVGMRVLRWRHWHRSWVAAVLAIMAWSL